MRLICFVLCSGYFHGVSAGGLQERPAHLHWRAFERTRQAIFVEYRISIIVKAVLGIRDILVRIRIPRSAPLTQCCGSMTFWGGSGSCYFRHWPSRCQQKTNFLTQFFLLITFWRYIYIIFQRYKVEKGHKIVGIKVFLTIFGMLIEGSGSGSASIPLTGGSGSGRPKNTWIRWIRIRINNTALNNGSGSNSGSDSFLQWI